MFNNYSQMNKKTTNLFEKFDDYKKQRQLQKSIQINYPKLILPKIEWIKSNALINYDLLPNTVGWSIKVIGKTGSGKTTFVSAFTDFLLAYIQQKFKIYILSPTHSQKWMG